MTTKPRLDRYLRDLLLVVEAYIDATGETHTWISGQLFGGASNRLYEIEHKGRKLTTGTLERAMQQLSASWPNHAKWPASVQRPPQSTAKRGIPLISPSLRVASAALRSQTA